MKIIFKRAKPADIMGWYKLFNNIISLKSAPYINTTNIISKKEMKSRAKAIAKGDSISFIAEINGKIIACTGSKVYKGRTAHRVDMGWFVDSAYRNKGIMSKLLKYALKELKKLGSKRAECEIVPLNKASIKIAEKAGFKREGVKKKAFRLDSGKYTDIYVYGRLL